MEQLKGFASLVFGHWVFVRNERAGGLLENFFLSAVIAILAIRLYLRLAVGTLPTRLSVILATDSATLPVQPAPAELHIAHILWGGFLMLAALILLLAFLSRSAKEIAAVIGGVGFGFFIDELGKFITGENNYFYQPAIALIYVFLVLLFIAIRAIQRPRILPERNAKANALEITKQLVMGEGGPEAKAQALEFLSSCDQKDPVIRALQSTLLLIEHPSSSRTHLLNRAKLRLRNAYLRLLNTWWFPIAMVALFVLYSISSLFETLASISWDRALIPWVGLGGFAVLALYSLRRRTPRLQSFASAGIISLAVLIAWAFLFSVRNSSDSLSDWWQPLSSYIEAGTGLPHTLLNLVGILQVFAPTLSGVLVLFGVIFIWHSRRAAYQMFHLAVLVSILLTQVFVFYEDQLLGVVGLIPNLLILVILRFLIRNTAEPRREGPLLAVNRNLDPEQLSR